MPPPVPTDSETLKQLVAEKRRTEKALDRCQQAIASLERHLESLNAEHLDLSKLKEAFHNYEASGEELDGKATELGGALAETEEASARRKPDSLDFTTDEKLDIKASIAVFADFEGGIKIAWI